MPQRFTDSVSLKCDFLLSALFYSCFCRKLQESQDSMSSRLEEAEHKVQSLQTGTSLLSLHSLGYCLNIPFKHNFRSLHKKCIYCLSFGGKHFSVNLFAHMICCLTAVHVSSVGRTRARSLIFQLTICSCCCVVHSTRLINKVLCF